VDVADRAQSSGETFPSATLLLIRHGQQQPEGGRIGRLSPLSEQGRQQAERVATALAAEPFLSVLYSSPLPRATATADVIGQRLSLIPRLDPRLAEFDLGTRHIDEIVERSDLLIWRPTDIGADGETLRSFCQRVGAFCDEVVARHPAERVVVVSHAGTMDAIVRWALGIAPEEPWTLECDVLHASITEVEVWPRGRVAGGAPRYAVLRRLNLASGRV
jgi:broad specificity phosphatase PhoE